MSLITCKKCGREKTEWAQGLCITCTRNKTLGAVAAPKDSTELRKAILKAGHVRMGKVTFQQKVYENGWSEPVTSGSQDIVEIGIDDLMQLIESYASTKAEAAAKLWDLLDDIDTLADAAKPNSLERHKELWQRMVRISEKRHAIMQSDGYNLTFVPPITNNNPLVGEDNRG